MLRRWVWRGLGVPLSWGEGRIRGLSDLRVAVRVAVATLTVPAIHRGRHLYSQTLSEGDTAHDATNLFYRGHSHPLQALTTAVIAHGELQERPVGKNSHSPCADGFLR